jgi:Rha family phage regulatory protein
MSEIIELAVTNGQPTTTSLAIAERFGKQHGHVLRDIEKLSPQNEGGPSKFGETPTDVEFQAFTELNFQPSAYKDSQGKLQPMYHVTKDGFMFLAMGFTGKEAAAWKVRFIAAFNAMERQLLENAAAQQIPKPDGTLFLSHRADIMVAADRIFRGVVRSSRSAGLKLPAALRRANAVALEKTGINMLDALQAHDHVDDLERNPPGAGNAAQVRAAEPSVSGFWHDWFGGKLGLPYTACHTAQCYKAYKVWCAGKQMRWLAHQDFTAKLGTHVQTQGQSFAMRVVRLRTGETMRMLIVGALPDGSINVWAAQQLREFEAALSRYCMET